MKNDDEIIDDFTAIYTESNIEIKSNYLRLLLIIHNKAKIIALMFCRFK